MTATSISTISATVTDDKKKFVFDDALQITGYGKYSVAMLGTCCLLILAMYIDIFGFSVMMPAVACDMGLTTAEQGLLSAVPLVGVMISSYAWGLSADTLGRRTTLLIAMPLGVIFNFAASLAPTYALLAVLKFLSGCFTSSANAAAFVLLGESLPSQYRSRNMFLMATTTMFAQFIICAFALPIFEQTFSIEVPLLSLVYRPWRLLMQVLCVPGAVGCVCILLLHESPKFLACRGRETDALTVLKLMYQSNTGLKAETYPVYKVIMEDETVSCSEDTSFLHRMWNQTAPLFKPPLLANSVKLYYLLLCAYMTSTGYTMWVPTISNAYFNGNNITGKTFCEVASISSSANSTTTDCNDTIQSMALYATMVYSAVSGFLTILLSFVVGPLGKKKTTALVFLISVACGFLLLFVKTPVLSVMLFFTFLYVALILGNVNTYLVEVNPTHLRGMATCLSVVVARGFGFTSVQLIAVLVTDHCSPMLAGYVTLVASGLVVSLFLPTENRKKEDACNHR